MKTSHYHQGKFPDYYKKKKCSSLDFFHTTLNCISSAHMSCISCWRAPQQGGFGLSEGIEPRPFGWSTVTPITTPLWSPLQPTTIFVPTRDWHDTEQHPKCLNQRFNVWKKCQETEPGSFQRGSRQCSLTAFAKNRNCMLEKVAASHWKSTRKRWYNARRR